MSTQNASNNKESCAIGCLSDRQAGQPTSAHASRLVKRDKSSTEPPPSDTKRVFSTAQTEEVTLQVGRNNIGEFLFQPIPDESASPTIAHVDWLGITLRLPEGKTINWLFQELHSVFGLAVTHIKNVGWNGYEHRAEMGKHGLVAWGGKFQRGTSHIEITGTGCTQITDWEKVQAWGMQHFARITRIDIAHDDLEGAQCNIERTLEWQESGGFNCGGRNAKVKLAGDWHDCTDSRTVYIGTRGNKMLRCYEKGKQLDDIESPWFRIELELRNKNRLLPWDMLTRPGQYLAGAYPCLAFLSTEQSKLKTTQKATAISLNCMTDNAARLSGKAINVLMQLHQEDANAVVDLLRRQGIPKRLESYEDTLKAMSKKGVEP
jgi:phage replication initiation protein